MFERVPNGLVIALVAAAISFAFWRGLIEATWLASAVLAMTTLAGVVSFGQIRGNGFTRTVVVACVAVVANIVLLVTLAIIGAD